MNVNFWNVCCSQKLNHCTLLSSDLVTSLRNFHCCNSETSSGGTMKRDRNLWPSAVE
jgi:hypothetical protein